MAAPFFFAPKRIGMGCSVNGGGFGKKFFEEGKGSVLVGPVADVREVKVGGCLDGQDLRRIINVFGAPTATRPAEFLDDDIFDGGKPRDSAFEINGLPAFEAKTIMRIIREQK